MKKYLQNLSYLFRHKWFVLIECWKRGLYWQGITHDLSKLLPSEFFPYADYFFDYNKKNVRPKTGYYKPADTGHSAFDLAWLMHQRRNKHHWQWWVLIDENGKKKVFEMTHKYRVEMLCDWIGAGKAQGSLGVRAWYGKNYRKMDLHPKTREWIELQLKFNYL